MGNGHTNGRSVGSMAKHMNAHSTKLHVVAAMLYVSRTQEFGTCPGNTNKKYLVELRNIVVVLDTTVLLHA